jgi:predicted kinase
MLVLLCGLAFAGKSRLAREIARQLGHRIVSLDALNAARGWGDVQPEDVPVDEWERSSVQAETVIERALRAGEPVVVDDCNPTRAARERFLAVARRAGSPACTVHVVIDADEGRRRVAANRASGERVDFDDALYEFHLRQFEPPGADEPHHVFDGTADATAWVTRHAAYLHGGEAGAACR